MLRYEIYRTETNEHIMRLISYGQVFYDDFLVRELMVLYREVIFDKPRELLFKVARYYIINSRDVHQARMKISNPQWDKI